MSAHVILNLLHELRKSDGHGDENPITMHPIKNCL